MTPPTPEQLLADPSASFWLKESLQKALARDPVDALSDAETLAAVLQVRVDSLLKRG